MSTGLGAFSRKRKRKDRVCGNLCKNGQKKIKKNIKRLEIFFRSWAHRDHSHALPFHSLLFVPC
jgi:hypothetical protein